MKEYLLNSNDLFFYKRQYIRPCILSRPWHDQQLLWLCSGGTCTTSSCSNAAMVEHARPTTALTLQRQNTGGQLLPDAAVAEHARPAVAWRCSGGTSAASCCVTLICGRSPLGAEGRRHTLCMQDKRIVHSVALMLEGESLVCCLGVGVHEW